jgi:hypothetical protein
MDWLRELLGIPSFNLGTSPRDSLFEAVIKEIVTPKDPRQVIEASYHYLPFFLFFAAALFVLEFVVRLLRGAFSDNGSGEMRELLYSTIWIFGLIPQIPGIIAGVRIFANITGRYALTLFLGVDTPEAVTARLSELTGVGPIDLMLSIVQIAGLLAIVLGLGIMVAAFAASVALMVMGMALRWLGDFGESAFRGALSITLFSSMINLILMLVLGGINALARAIYPDSALWRGFMNTGAIILAAWIIWKAIQRFSSTIRAIASKGAEGYRRARGRRSDGDTEVDPDGSYRQERAGKNSRKRQERAMSDDNDQPTSGSATSRNKRTSAPSDESSDSGGAHREAKQDYDEPQPRTRRDTSTAARSVERGADESSDPMAPRKKTGLLERDKDDSSANENPVRESPPRRSARNNPEEHNQSLRTRRDKNDT